MELKAIARNLGDVISQNSPTILTGLSVGGLLTTTILAVRATPKAMTILDNHDLLIEDMTKRTIVGLTWKCYIPAMATGLATIACIIGANHISLRRNAALASLYGLTEAAFKEYQAKVVETIGRSKELKVRDDIAEDQVKRNPVGTNEVIFTGKGDVLCYDSLSGRYFKSDIEQIRRSVNTLNRELLTDMFLTLNDLYYALGLSGTKLGDEMGWDIDKGLLEINFSAQVTENFDPCLVLNYDLTPRFINK